MAATNGMDQMFGALLSKIDVPALLVKIVGNMGEDPHILLAKFKSAADAVKTFDARLSALETAAAENTRLLQELVEWTKTQQPKT